MTDGDKKISHTETLTTKINDKLNKNRCLRDIQECKFGYMETTGHLDNVWR